MKYPGQEREGGRSQGASFWWHSLPRGLALFFGGFALLNILGDFRQAGFDANLSWIDLRFLPAGLRRALVLVAAASLVSYGLRPPGSGWRRGLALGAAGILGLASLANAAQFYLLLARGTIHAGMPVPLSLFVTAALGLVLASTAGAFCSRLTPVPYSPSDARETIGEEPGHPGGKRPEDALCHGTPRGRRCGGAFSALAVCLGCLILFPLAQMFCFGKTDYRRPADAVVVFGARAYADGRPSDALADRVRTACGLYREGLARKLVFSGGPGDGAVPETEAMRRMALQLGVKGEDILLDAAGSSTQATVRNTEPMLAQLQAARVLVVSHFYHLPRIKLAYQRAGWEVYTVPARESYLLSQMPYNVAREVAALWVYYLRPLARA